MNSQIISSRFKDVLDVDSINNTQSDFLSTHVPFRKITVTNEPAGTPISDYVSEEEIFSQYFDDSSIYNKHQLIVVNGSSGSGKSHFIRWIAAKLAARDEHKDDVVLMIRRSDNTLKGTIKQFLEIDEVKNLKNKGVYERLVKANQNMSEQRFKYEIYHKFLIEIAEDENRILNKSDRKNLRELLASSEFEEKMLMPGGPIERIYSKIVDDNSERAEDTLALFDVNDFILDFDFNSKLKNNASKKAIKMANKLLPIEDGVYEDEECNPEIITGYMNSKVETVIQSCAGIEPGDFQQIFKEIRQELFLQGKNLILLIEDITSCTGINQDLLNALIIKHTGANEVDMMCRLVSVIGTTSEYFKEFRSNYIQRITTNITIEDGSIGHNQDDLVQFVAKYLNVMSLPIDVVNSWYKDGALVSDYPIRQADNIEWETYNYDGKRISLYPLTKRSIINMYTKLNFEKTPRYIIRTIIEPAVDNILKGKNTFPRFLKNSSVKPSYDVDSRVKSIVNNMHINEEEKEEYRDRIFSIVDFWGDGTLNVKNNSIGCVNSVVFKEFGLEVFAERVLGKSISNATYVEQDDPITTATGTNVNPSEKKGDDVKTKEPPKIVTNKKFDEFARILSDWYYDKKMFIKAYTIRDAVGSFAEEMIPWQREGVSQLSVDLINKSNVNWVEIEDQDRNKDNALVFLERNDETYQLLLAIGKYYYLGDSSWRFPEAGSAIRVLTLWFDRHKKLFVDTALSYDEKKVFCPDYVEYAILAEVYRGIINADYSISKLSDITLECILKNAEERSKSVQKGHSDEWCNIHDTIIYNETKADKNADIIRRHFNLIQGNSRNAVRTIIKYSDLEATFKKLKKEGFIFDADGMILDNKIKGRDESKHYLKQIASKLDKLVKAELHDAKNTYLKVCKYLGFSENADIEVQDIREILNEIIDFYKDIEQNGINVEIKKSEALTAKEHCSQITKALSILQMDMTEKTDVEILAIYSCNPLKIVKTLLNLFDKVYQDYETVNSLMTSEKESLTRTGNWSGDVDPRFEKEKVEFETLVKGVEV